MRSPTLAAIALSVLGCGGTSPGVSGEVEPLVTITQGLYGQTTFVGDLGSSLVTAASLELSVTGSALPSPTAARSGGPQGFFEVVLPAGNFTVCAPSGRVPCTDVVVSSGRTTRRDYELGFGGGFWK